MEKQLFDELVLSIQEAGAIQRGETEPTRVFTYNQQNSELLQPTENTNINIRSDIVNWLQSKSDKGDIESQLDTILRSIMEQDTSYA